VLRPDDPPRVLTTTEAKAELVAGLGADEMLVIPFTPELSRFTAEEFIDEVLMDVLGVRQLSVGANFRFGHEARGDADMLHSRQDFETTVVPLVEHDGGPVSSSRIRKLVSEGDVLAAADLLEAPFRLEGEVVPGDARGRELGVPTINLRQAADAVLPAAGIYAALAGGAELGTDVPAAVSIGVRPTFADDGDLRVEAHLIGFEGDLYGRNVRLEFIERLRDELRFESAEELVEQMKKDVEQTRKAVARAREP